MLEGKHKMVVLTYQVLHQEEEAYNLISLNVLQYAQRKMMMMQRLVLACVLCVQRWPACEIDYGTRLICMVPRLLAMGCCDSKAK